MKSIIIYSTKYGSAEKAARKIKEKLEGEVILVNIMKENISSIEEYDNVILGGSIYVGKIQKKLKEYINKNLAALMKKRIGLFICAAEKDANKKEKELQAAFPADLYNKAISREILGYEIYYDKLNFFEKKIMNSIMGVKTNVSELCEESINNLVKNMTLR